MNNKNHFVSRYDMLSGVRINDTLQDIIEEYQLQKEKYERQLEADTLTKVFTIAMHIAMIIASLLIKKSIIE